MPKTSVPANPRAKVKRLVLRYAHEHPDYGQARVAEAVVRTGLKISAAGVRYIWQAHNLETAAKRAAALRNAGAARLTCAQKTALAQIGARRGGVPPDGEAVPLGRERLLAVAVREFSRKGFARSSIRDIAEAAGIQPGSVYYHFASKDELFVAAHSEGMRLVARAVEEAIAKHSDPWARLEAACTEHIRYLVSGNDLTVWTGASLLLFNSPEMQQRLRTERDRYEAIYRRLIAALPIPAGINRSLLRLQLLGALNWTRTWYRPCKGTPAEIARHLVKVLREPLAVSIAR